MPMYTSVSSYSFSQYIRLGKMTQLDTIEKAAELGFSAMEFTDLDVPDGMTENEFASQIAEKAKHCGISVAAYTVSACLIKNTVQETAAEIERIKRKIETAAVLGAPLIRHDAYFSQNKYRSFDASLPELAENIREISDFAASLGIKTTVENHGQICQDSDRMERLFCAVNHQNFGLLVDIGNFMCVDEDPAAAVSKVAPYAFHVHAKDFIKYAYSENPLQSYFTTRGMNKLVPTICGTGDVPLEQCLAILKNAGYCGCVSIEYEGSIDCVAALQAGLSNLKTAIERI